MFGNFAGFAQAKHDPMENGGNHQANEVTLRP